MTDIVERLRNHQLRNMILREAADEIEQLNEQCDIFVRRINDHAREIERLRALIVQHENEIDRLNEAVRALEPKP